MKRAKTFDPACAQLTPPNVVSSESIDAINSGLPSAGAVTSLLDLHSDLTRQHDFQVIQPLPGHYELHFLSHPAWVVRITITAK